MPETLQHDPVRIALAHGVAVHEPPKYWPWFAAHVAGEVVVQPAPAQHAPV